MAIAQKHTTSGTTTFISLTLPNPPGKDEGEPGPSRTLIHRIRGSLFTAASATIRVELKWTDISGGTTPVVMLGTVVNGASATQVPFNFEFLSIPSPADQWDNFRIEVTSSGAGQVHDATNSSHLYIEYSHLNFSG